jgi:hypothetical protein
MNSTSMAYEVNVTFDHFGWKEKFARTGADELMVWREQKRRFRAGMTTRTTSAKTLTAELP